MEVSSATVRKELAQLEVEGYIQQPHTSAGRIPTVDGYRYYIDHLHPFKMKATTRQRIGTFFDSVQLELGKLLQATTRLLSDITSYPAVVIGPKPSGEVVKGMHIVQLEDSRVLLVVVTESGRVCREVCELPQPVDDLELEGIERRMLRSMVGMSLGAQSDHTEDFTRLSPAAQEGWVAIWEGVNRAAQAAADLYIDGTGHLVEMWEDVNSVRQVLEVLEREAQVLEILAGSTGTLIKLGQDLPLEDLAVVSTSFDGTGDEQGRVGVMGPMRMNYSRTISAVETIGRELGDHISG